MLFWAEGLWTAEPDTVPRPGELRCRPLADCSAAGWMRTEGASSPFGHRGGGASGECGVPQVRQHRITEHEQGGPTAGGQWPYGC